MPLWVFPSLFIAALLHVVEEYYVPGGFFDFVKRLGTGIAEQLTLPVAIVVNGLFLLLALLAAILWRDYPVPSLSIAGLLLVNALIHVAGSLRAKAYAPGLVTAVILYIPLSLAVFVIAAKESFVSTQGLVVAMALGFVYHILLFGYLWFARHRSKKAAVTFT
jgi:hypothetical protein